MTCYYIIGVVSKHLLEEFQSPLSDDADGSLWFLTALLTAARDVIKSAGGRFSNMSFQAVNTIRTIVPLILELLMGPGISGHQLQLANHLARDELLSTLLLLLEGHERKSIGHRAYFFFTGKLLPPSQRTRLC